MSLYTRANASFQVSAAPSAVRVRPSAGESLWNAYSTDRPDDLAEKIRLLGP